MNCAICNHPDAEGEIWVYSPPKGGDVFYPVCAFCLRHPKVAAAIVDGINRKSEGRLPMNTYRNRPRTSLRGEAAMTYNVKPIESLTANPWYEVVDADNEFHLWIVEHNPTTDALTCTCEAAWCPHRAAVTQEVLAADYQAEQADAIARRHGQY